MDPMGARKWPGAIVLVALALCAAFLFRLDERDGIDTRTLMAVCVTAASIGAAAHLLHRRLAAAKVNRSAFHFANLVWGILLTGVSFIVLWLLRQVGR